MEKHLIKFLLFILFSFVCFAGGDTKKLNLNEVPTYTGEAIDLNDLHMFKLFKGKEKTFIQDSLSRHQIWDIVSKESNVWWIEISFFTHKEVVDQGNIWLRADARVNAYELYINRNLFIKNGVVKADQYEEVSGTNIITKIIGPATLMDGSNKIKNTISIKFSNFEYKSATQFIDLIITPYSLIFDRAVTWVYAPLIMCGFFLLAFGLNISFYFALKKQIIFIFLALFFLLNLFQVIEEVYTHAGEPSIDYFYTFFIGTKINYLNYSLLALCLVFEFGFEFKKRVYLGGLFAIYVCCVILLFGSNVREFYLSIPPLLISVYAITQKKENGVFILGTLVLLVVLTYLDDYDVIDSSNVINQNLILKSIALHTDMIGVTVFAFAMIYTAGKRIFNQQKLLDETQLKSARLENELLQKHISPHFIMNSLMSLQELIDVDKQKASEMIDSLSEEFHLLASMSKEKLIDLSEELEICKVHLKIMGLQQRATFTFESEGLDGTEMIPPAVIHTLVENGLTHGYSGKEDGHFKLTKSKENEFTVFTLFNNSNKKKKPKNGGSKTGLNYVRARLEESYSGRWELNSDPVENGWEVSIRIKGLV